MENNEVEYTREPSVESRFGFSKDGGPLSKRTIKVSATCTVLGLTLVMLLSSPDQPLEESSGIRAPETSDINRNREAISLESYSASEESDRLKAAQARRGSRKVGRLPGLEKLDRSTVKDIPPGTVIKAVLLTGASNGPVKAEVKEALRIRGETLIPSGTILLGKGRSTEERLFVHFSKLLVRGGEVQETSADAAEAEDQTVGLKGSRVGRYAARYATAVGLNFVGGMAEGLQAREIVGTQVVTKPDAKNALLNGASRAAYEMGNEEMQKIRSAPVEIHVEAGKEILVMFGAND